MSTLFIAVIAGIVAAVLGALIVSVVIARKAAPPHPGTRRAAAPPPATAAAAPATTAAGAAAAPAAPQGSWSKIKSSTAVQEYGWHIGVALLSLLVLGVMWPRFLWFLLGKFLFWVGIVLFAISILTRKKRKKDKDKHLDSAIFVAEAIWTAAVIVTMWNIKESSCSSRLGECTFPWQQSYTEAAETDKPAKNAQSREAQRVEPVSLPPRPQIILRGTGLYYVWATPQGSADVWFDSTMPAGLHTEFDVTDYSDTACYVLHSAGYNYEMCPGQPEKKDLVLDHHISFTARGDKPRRIQIHIYSKKDVVEGKKA